MVNTGKGSTTHCWPCFSGSHESIVFLGKNRSREAQHAAFPPNARRLLRPIAGRALSVAMPADAMRCLCVVAGACVGSGAGGPVRAAWGVVELGDGDLTVRGYPGTTDGRAAPCYVLSGVPAVCEALSTA